MTTTHGFELEREQFIPELRTQARLYRHVKTGARLLSLSNDDENKAFAITFRTPVHDSTGVPHILEHSVLAGSRKYPTKEPFTELLKGSLKTFLNAMTYPDKTVYPVASQNVKDFYNLVDVYLDAVFYPLLKRTTLQQEGWHFELENADDPLIYKGVVFNEMKGVYAAPEAVLGEMIQRSLYPDTTYAYDSGGDPRHIPDLTYDHFKGYHDSLYHPSNAYLYFYGDDDPTERLRYLDSWLSQFKRQEIGSGVSLQQRFDHPRHIVEHYATDEDADTAKKSYVTVNWLLGEATDPDATLALQTLAYLLTGMQASPLRRALIDSGLGEELAGTGFSDELRQMNFSTGLKGVALDDVDKVETLILDTLAGLARDGLDPDTVQAAVNSLEFDLRENNTGGFPRGLGMLFWFLNAWLHGGDPLAHLAFEGPLARLKERLGTGRYFESLIDQWLVQNSHRTTVVLHPDPALNEREAADERARLDTARARMKSSDVNRIIAETKALKELQNTPDTPEALATIPSLKLSDLDKVNKLIPLDVQQRQHVQTLYHDLFTNGILYLDLGFDLHSLPERLLPYVPLFGRALLEMGTETEDFVRLSQRINRDTGGIWRATRSGLILNSQTAASYLFLRSKAMLSQVPHLLGILRDVLLTARFDNRDRFLQMVLEAKARMEPAIIFSGSSFVDSRLSAVYNEADWADEQMGGLASLFFVRRLAEQVTNDWPSVLARLEELRTTLINRGAMIANVTVDEAAWATLAPQVDAFLAELPHAARLPVTWSPSQTQANEAFVIPGQINYVGKGANLFAHGYQYHGSWAVVARYLSTGWLHEKVRVQGGAYGGFCSLDRFSGVFNYLSYRDPNLQATLDAYDRTADYLRHADLSDDELTKTIIGAIGGIDTYRLPDAKGWFSMERYLFGESNAVRQRVREEVLGTTIQDFRRFGDALQAVTDHGRVVVLGSQSAIEQAAAARPGWLEVTRVGL
ncbi:MAG: insulinase family protein [Anaerolineae bacterium]|nr:insulinase family protein [Anaerolineae bacterium]